MTPDKKIGKVILQAHSISTEQMSARYYGAFYFIGDLISESANTCVPASPPATCSDGISITNSPSTPPFSWRSIVTFN